MNSKIFINKIKRRVAQVSIGASAIRNQGAPDLIRISRDYFEDDIDLKVFRRKLNSKTYTHYLDELTNELRNKYPKKGRSWGAARKALNLFFRDVVYNRYLSDYLEIPNDSTKNNDFLKNLEVPLDKDVAKGLRIIFNDLPKWQSIRKLTKKESDAYQIKALEYANNLGTARIHLDLILWRTN